MLELGGNLEHRMLGLVRILEYTVSEGRGLKEAVHSVVLKTPVGVECRGWGCGEI